MSSISCRKSVVDILCHYADAGAPSRMCLQCNAAEVEDSPCNAHPRTACKARPLFCSPPKVCAREGAYTNIRHEGGGVHQYSATYRVRHGATAEGAGRVGPWEWRIPGGSGRCGRGEPCFEGRHPEDWVRELGKFVLDHPDSMRHNQVLARPSQDRMHFTGE